MSNVDELTAPINRLAKQVKLILTKIEDLDKKLEEHLKPANSEEDKEIESTAISSDQKKCALSPPLKFAKMIRADTTIIPVPRFFTFLSIY